MLVWPFYLFNFYPAQNGINRIPLFFHVTATLWGRLGWKKVPGSKSPQKFSLLRLEQNLLLNHYITSALTSSWYYYIILFKLKTTKRRLARLLIHSSVLQHVCKQIFNFFLRIRELPSQFTDCYLKRNAFVFIFPQEIRLYSYWKRRYTNVSKVVSI